MFTLPPEGEWDNASAASTSVFCALVVQMLMSVCLATHSADNIIRREVKANPRQDPEAPAAEAWIMAEKPLG